MPDLNAPTETTEKPKPQLPDIFPPSLADLKGVTGKRQSNAIKKLVRQPIMPKALQKANESKELIARIKS